jgi:hypothetical protein
VGANVSSQLTFTCHSAAGSQTLSVDLKALVIAGWTGRDRAAVEKHIKELEELGVKRPATTPIYYRCAASLVTTASAIEVPGNESSGEVEFMLLQWGGKLWVGLGSDHTDRQVETYNITVSKQMCAKPVAKDLWLFDDVKDHWDELKLRSSIEEKGSTVAYQEGSVTAMIDPRELISIYTNGGALADGTMMFCGTLAAKGGIRTAPRFSYELEDPKLGRKIAHSYTITTLPVVG